MIYHDLPWFTMIYHDLLIDTGDISNSCYSREPSNPAVNSLISQWLILDIPKEKTNDL